jgi:hypothetical protein
MGKMGNFFFFSKPFVSKSYIFSTLAIFSWLTDSQLYYHLCHSFLLFYLYEFRKNCPFAHLTHLAPHFFVLNVLVRWSSNYYSCIVECVWVQESCPSCPFAHLVPHFFVLHVSVRWSSNYDSYAVDSSLYVYENSTARVLSESTNSFNETRI